MPATLIRSQLPNHVANLIIKARYSRPFQPVFDMVPPSNALIMDKVLDDLNVKVQNQCRNFLAKDAEFVTHYNKTDIDK